jgi:NTP pyrophosphatase (non-canonical NTP hydrolase)
MQTSNFNGLSPAEAERLAVLAEELGESVQAIGKILRHGYESRHPLGGPTNRQALEKELGDVRHAMIRLCDAGDLSKQHIHDMADVKALNIVKYLHHQTEQNAS